MNGHTLALLLITILASVKASDASFKLTSSQNNEKGKIIQQVPTQESFNEVIGLLKTSQRNQLNDLESDHESAIESELDADLESAIESNHESDHESDIESKHESNHESNHESDHESDIESDIESELDADLDEYQITKSGLIALAILSLLAIVSVFASIYASVAPNKEH